MTTTTSTAPIGRTAFTVTEFAARNGIGRTTAFMEIRRGRLKAQKVGKRTIITAAAEAEWQASLPVARPTSTGE